MAGKKGQKINKETCIRFKEYYLKNFPEWSEEQCINAANKIKRQSNYRCIEYYEHKYPNLSHEEHEKLLKEKLEQQKTNYPNNIKYYEKLFPELSHEEHLKMLNEYSKAENYQCIEYYEKRFPELSHEEHLKMRQDKVKTTLEKMPDVSGENNPNSKSRTTLEQRQERSPFSKKFYEKRNLTEEDRYNFTSNIKREYTTQLSYWLHKGYSETEAKEKLIERQKTFTLEKCTAKYGEEEGTKRYHDRQQKWLKSLYKSFQINGDGRSKQSRFAKEIIKECCKYLNISIPKNEKYISYDGKVFAYDFTYNKKIIEFQGDYWHCNPALFDETFFNKVKQATAKEIWEYDKIKKHAAEHYGYEVFYVWEYDYTKDPENEIKKCLEFLSK